MCRNCHGCGDNRHSAVFPQPIEEGQAFLTAHGVSGLIVKQAMLWQLGVNGTPTLLLVDDSGKVVESWSGRLTPSQEAVVVARLEKLP